MRRGLLLLLVLMFLAASVTVASAKEVHHGQTNVSIPSSLTVHAEANPNLPLKGTGFQVKVSHSDPGKFCHKVSAIRVTFSPGPDGKPETHLKQLYLCSFNERDATFDFPFYGDKERDRRLLNECKNSGKNGARLTVPHPYYGKISVVLHYANGDKWEMNYNYPPITLVCDACPPVAIRPYLKLEPGKYQYVKLDEFVSGGWRPYLLTHDEKETPPPGCIRPHASLLNCSKPVEGTYNVNLTVLDSCQTAYNRVNGKIRVDVKDPTPPKLTGLTITPASISSAGGEVVFKVTATDSKAISEVNSAVSGPGWSQRIYLTRVSGNESSGVWQGSYKAPVNTSRKDISYTVDFYAGDKDGNKAQISGTFVVKGDPAGSTMQKGHSILGN